MKRLSFPGDRELTGASPSTLKFDFALMASGVRPELIVALFPFCSGAIALPCGMWDDLRLAMDPTIAAVSTLLLGAHQDDDQRSKGGAV